MIFLFAWRYFKAKKTTNAINIISWISILAIVIGTTALILVLSVFNGFEGLVKSLYSSFYPDLKISATKGKVITLNEAQLQKLRSVKGVKAFSLVVEEKALLQNRAFEEDSADYQSVILLKGVDSLYTNVNNVQAHIVEGAWNTGTADDPLLVLGAGIQNAVGVQSDRNIKPLSIYMSPVSGVDLNNPMQSLSSANVNTAGTFIIQQDFDNKYVLTNIAFVKQMAKMPADDYSAAEISIMPAADAEAVQQDFQKILGVKYLVQNRYEQNASLFSVMRLEKWIIYVILVLILVVAAFNMVGALTMLVLEKKQDINVLHALGASSSTIQKIFLSEGILLALIGGGVGMLLAYAIGWAQLTFHLVPMQGSTFIIDYFPVKMVLSDFILVGITVFIIALIASWIPARKAARQQRMLREE